MVSKAAAYAQTSQNNDQLVIAHAGLVKKIAHHLKGRLPASVLLDDLIQSGMIGLLEAAKNFDGSKGASFETFAGIRIRGAMLDEIRRGDWVPRSVHRNSRAVQKAIDEVEKEHGRDAKEHEIAEKLGINLDEYAQMLNDIASGKIIGMDDLGVSEDVLVVDGQAESDDSYSHAVSGRFQTALAEAIKGLPEKEALTLSLYYDEELNLKEIGQVLNVSESRVSQIHSQAMVRLKGRLNNWS
ncbi:RNA polymerase sigma factor FliA [Psychrobium sp. 1_MG-2023]|uniref:RNA polymerase sigma factor FliA n=1 Tax=Psychrobium sp. 1_MG-2023 TaxID=3062624 RepID=UPI000C32F07D|nr:RNA polymerase sigma factor FliA [Psychrobium sp. 1_MG-2023]MDP2559821.1 RNA polymerase sigma factor FliA [Psychrobium sp. 1_MG-2023]PKF59166.1 RNA polymerase sigma factor FliA [Alteromonadales bacterium alter-6D02]